MAGTSSTVVQRLEAFERRVLAGEVFDRYRIAAELGMARREIEQLTTAPANQRGPHDRRDDPGAAGA